MFLFRKCHFSKELWSSRTPLLELQNHFLKAS